MSIDFTNLAIAIIVVFGVVGWMRGVRRIAIATGGVFFAMVLVDLIGNQFVAQLSKVGLRFQPATTADVFRAALFLFSVYVVQLFGARVLLGAHGDPHTRKERLNGAVLGLVNGFLIVADTARYAGPYLTSTASSSGGWSFHLLLPHFSHPDAGTFSLGITPTTITIVPSPLVKMYNSLPTALVVLFAFLVFVFLGTMYGRFMRSRE